MRFAIILLFLNLCQNIHSQTLEARINGYNGKVYLSSLSGEKTSYIDSTIANGKSTIKFDLSKKNFHAGIYRLSFDKNKWIDLINDGEEINIITDVKLVLDSMHVIKSESNKLYYTFLKLNKAYKTKTELLQLILARYPKDDEYYSETKKRLNEIQNEYIQFAAMKSQLKPNSFIAKYVRSAQLPVVDTSIPLDKQLAYLKANALNNVDFNNSLLISSDVFSNKTIEYLTYYRNPQLPLELLEKEFMSAVDSILNKAKVNQLVYQHITEYLIDGFKKFGFDKVLDYIVENYVIKDDLCLDVKTEGLIKRRIEQAKNFKIGKSVPNIVLSDISGKEINLINIKAEKTLIVFYASWCPHCKELLPKLNEIKKEEGTKGIEILAISLDNKKEDWMNFVKEKCSNLINVSDLNGWDGKSANDYFIYATPTMFMIDKEGKIAGKPMTFGEVKNLVK